MKYVEPVGTVDILTGGTLSMEQRILLMQMDGNTAEEVVKQLDLLSEQDTEDVDREMIGSLITDLKHKLLTTNIDIAAERALGNPLD